MSPTLADSLALTLPDVPAALVPHEARAPLVALAGRLAPIHRAGFEVRLARGGEIDFQQGVEAGDGEPAILRRHLRREGDATLDAFLARWEEAGSPLNEAIDDLWLEFDRPPEAARSVFVGFPRGPVAPADRRPVVREALDLLAGRSAWEGFAACVDACFDALPDGATVSHVGLMLGRPGPFVRVNVKRLSAESAEEYLRTLGWAGDPAAAARLVARLARVADGVTVCVDAGEGLGPGVGLECHVGPQPPHDDGRWRALLDVLVDDGLCSGARAEALLTWPGTTTPATAGASWPPDLVRQALRRPDDHFSALERRLSHVKVTLDADGDVSAKGYFGFMHRWLRPPVAPAAPGPARRRSPEPAGVAAATGFLLAARDREGWWRDFSGTEGASAAWSDAFGWSDEWVSAYVACALAGADDAEAAAAARGVWDLLVERRAPTAGWGYNRWAIVDADSTTWALRLARAVGAGTSPPARSGRTELERHALDDGGVTTYRADARFRPVAAELTAPDGATDGWCRTSHGCVSAGAAPVVGERALSFLRRTQRDDGSWRAYWWDDDAYATGLAAEALAGAGDAARVAAAARWASRRLAPDGGADDSPFATAWCVRVLRGAGEAADRSRNWLLERQEADGGWEASALLLAPRPDVRDSAPGAPRLECRDDARVFTTATVLSALAP